MAGHDLVTQNELDPTEKSNNWTINYDGTVDTSERLGEKSANISKAASSINLTILKNDKLKLEQWSDTETVLP